MVLPRDNLRLTRIVIVRGKIDDDRMCGGVSVSRSLAKRKTPSAVPQYTTRFIQTP